jgi:RNA polymerase sigma-70 factor (ECF subfamily)
MFWKNDSSYEDVAVIEYMDNLFSYAMVLTRNRGEAEDLVQETYLRAMRAMTRLRAGSNVKSWLLVILRNIWLNQLRRRRTTPMVVEIDETTANVVVETSKGPHALYVSKRECEQVREAIQHLPVDFREVILLREYEELSYQEIASVLGCPIGTVMSRLARARSKLRPMLSVTLQISDPRMNRRSTPKRLQQ